jgi:hypothetical protein
MQREDLATIRELVAATLPRKYEPLLLTFYGHEARASGDGVIIGDDYGTELHLTPDGSVVSIDPEGELPRRFVNSSVERLAEFLQVVSATKRSDDDAELAMWRKLADIDPRAFVDEENWWAVVLEQVRLEAGW